MIERTFPLHDASIEVTFQWDSGDPSVGIWPGWGGEDTGIIVKAGPLRLELVFDPASETVADWPVTGCVYFGDGLLWNLPEGKLGEHPSLLAAVSETWAQVQALEELEGAAEDGSSCQFEVDELLYRLDPEWGTLSGAEATEIKRELGAAQQRLLEATARYQRLQEAYQARYSQPVAA